MQVLNMDQKDWDNKVIEALYPETKLVESDEDHWAENQCNKCSAFYKSGESKEEHERRFHPKNFPCSECSRVFAHKSGLTHHMPMHSEKKAFFCNICGKAFRQRSGLSHHVPTHRTFKSYTCETCGKSFSQSSGLIHHRATHNPFKNYCCTICGKRFAQQSGLVHHRSIHVKKDSDLNDVQVIFVNKSLRNE